MFVYMEPTSPKAHDLQRDSRYALHCAVEDRDGGEGEFSVRGKAHVIDEPALRDQLFKNARADGSNPQEHYILFEFDIESALSTIYDGGQVMRERWKAS